MKNPVFNLPELFKKKASDALSNSTTEFPQLDLDDLGKEWKLKELGIQDGKKNIPRKNTESFSANELKIITTISGFVGEQKNQAVAWIQEHEREFMNLDMGEQMSNLQNFARNAKNKFESTIQKADEKLFKAKEEFESFTENYLKFKSNNCLKDIAHPPDSIIFFWGILFFEVILETVLNVNFFAEVSDTYFIGGMTNAFILSILNVFILGFVFGKKCFWYKNHIKSFYKFLGIASFFIFLFFALALNFFVMHARVMAKPPNPSDEITIIFQNMYSFSNAPGMLDWFLFILGFTAACIAFATSYKMDDPYPGYGDIQRKLDQAREDYLEQKNRIENDLKKEKDRQKYEVGRIVTVLQNNHARAKDLLKNIESYLTKWQYAYEYYEDVCRYCLQKYREQNQAVRTETSPKHFNTKFSFSNSSPKFKNNNTENTKMLRGVTKYVDQIGNHRTSVENEIIRNFEIAINKFLVIESKNKL